MRKLIIASLAPLAVLAACTTTSDAIVLDGTENQAEAKTPDAYSLSDAPLFSAAPSPATVAKYEAAKAAYEQDPDDADKLIWFGRRAAYMGDYNQAIDIFTMGIEKHPEDARMLRHRGHRYISTRQFDAAIADLEKASVVMLNSPDEIEPDGLPNPQNIPLTSLYGNVRYHLGLAHYLKHDFESARKIYAKDFELAENDDGIVASGHWLYMILRRMGRDAEAEQVLTKISPDMNIIENTYYHRATLFYKGELSYDEAMPEDRSGVGTAGILYGIANWHLYNGETDKAYALMNELVDGPSWAAFGYIAAEADLVAAGELD